MTTLWKDRIVVGGVTFNDRWAHPIPGLIKWAVDLLTPWDATPELDIEFASIGAVDGEIPGDSATFTGKQYTIGGYVLAEDRLTAQTAWDIIVRDALPREIDIPIVRYEPIPKFTTVRLNGPKEPTWTQPEGFRWAASVRAYDPLRYAVDPWNGSIGISGQASGGTTFPLTFPVVFAVDSAGEANWLEVINSGTVPTPKVFITLTGPLTGGGWRIVNETTDALLYFNVDVPPGGELVIDMQAEVATLSGQVVTASIVGDFFKMAPGLNVVRLLGEYDDQATMTIYSYSAWE